MAIAVFAFSLTCNLVWAEPARAVGLIRDAETETLVRDYAKPIFQAAGLNANDIHIHIVNDRNFNAFVVDDHNMFINAGTLMTAQTPNQVIGVIAHECGHITGRHLAQLHHLVEQLKSTALMLQLLGLAAAAAGAAGGSGNAAGAGMGAAMGGQEALMRMVLAYRQDQESAADRAGVQYLTESHQSAKGMLQSFQTLAEKTIGVNGINPFLQTHPLPQRRLARLRQLVMSSPYYNKKDPPELQFRHDLVRAKLVGFLDPPEVVFDLYPKSDQSYPAYYARAIATYRRSGVDAAMPLFDALIKGQPNWPYFHELKGQFLFESGRAAAAIPELKTAVSLAPKEPLIRIAYAQALLGVPTPRHIDQAIHNLQTALARESDSAMGYTQLAMAYGRKADLVPRQARTIYLARADLASAEAYFYEGKIKLSKMLARRAQKGLPAGTPEWLQADDLIAYHMPKVK